MEHFDLEQFWKKKAWIWFYEMTSDKFFETAQLKS